MARAQATPKTFHSKNNGMKTLITIATLTLALALGAFGQTTTTEPAPSAPREIVAFTGAAYNHSGSPKVTMTLGGAYPVSDSAYLGVVADVGFKRNSQPTVTIRPEFIREVFRVNGHPIYGLFGIGASFAARDPAAIVQQLVPVLRTALENVGTNFGYSAATGVTTNFRLYRGLHALPAFRVVKGSLNDTQFVFGVNFGGKATVAKK
jgi:hypothetical protein